MKISDDEENGPDFILELEDYDKNGRQRMEFLILFHNVTLPHRRIIATQIILKVH